MLRSNPNPNECRERGAALDAGAGMETTETAQLARVCRVQAGLASTEETRAALLELARLFEDGGVPGSVPLRVEPVAKQPE